VTVAAQLKRAPLVGISEALAWSSSENFTEVLTAFESRVLDALSDLTTAADAQGVGEALGRMVESASNAALMRVLLAPDVTARLLWRENSATGTVAQYLCDALTAEASREGLRPHIVNPIWTALGDLLALPSGEMTGSAAVAGTLPLDLDKPDEEWHGFQRYPEDAASAVPLEGEQRETVLQRMTTAYRAILQVGPVLGEFVAQFTKVVALRRTDDAEATSFSSPNYIGRVNILNPQLLDEVLLAEALVHETIHSFLFMQDQRPVWGLTESPSTVPSKVVSPWSGRELPLSAYVQACCVWFGLVNFWGLASTTSTGLPAAGMRRRLGQSLSGFLKGPLLDRIDRGSRHVVEPAVASAIEQMQYRVHEVVRAIP